ncbi:MAG: cyclic nucleotide-binding domain-containing protein [Verrucomicrobiota bacterium]
MAAIVRLANAGDAPKWLELLKATLGDDYPVKDIYNLAWIANQLNSASGHETWISEVGGQIQSTISILRPVDTTNNPVANLGRNLNRPESYADGSAEALIRKISDLVDARGQMIVVRVPAADNPQQILFEQCNYVCVGFQPLKHILRTRQGMLFYLRTANPVLAMRSPLSESLPQISELAALAFESLKIPNPLSVRDGATGYPLQTEIKLHDATFEDFEVWRLQARAANPQLEVSTGYNRGAGFLRLATDGPFRAFLGQRDNKIVCGLAYFNDEQDRCVRILDSFATDDLCMGALFNHAVRTAQELLSASYVEVDILANCPRLLKCTEQLGFVPIAYFPGFFVVNNKPTDVVKLIKLNMLYTPENVTLTTQATAVARVVDQSFQDQRMGVAIINLLRTLPIFEGLGDGELRKIARLFVQKLYRPGERVFNVRDAGNEAYIVMRGQVDICLNEESRPIATINNGQIFGELAFLDGSPRTAMAIASQASILLVVQRSAFNELVQREPHLGMVVMRNVAIDLSNKLRKANTAINTTKK